MIHIYGIHRMREKNVVRYSSSCSCLAFRLFYRAGSQRISLLLAKGVFYALDNIRHAADLVVIGDGQLLHTGWLYPHLASSSPGCPGNQLGNRPARCNLK